MLEDIACVRDMSDRVRQIDRSLDRCVVGRKNEGFSAESSKRR